MSAGQCSHTIPEGIDVEMNADNTLECVIDVVCALSRSLYLPVLPYRYRVRSDH
jgi:hypothetical protein